MRRDIYEKAFFVFDQACRDVDPEYQTFADDSNSVITFTEHKEGMKHPSGYETGHAAGLTSYVISGENDSDVYMQGADFEASRKWQDYNESFATRRAEIEISMRADNSLKYTATEALQTLIHEWALHGHPYAAIINGARKKKTFEKSVRHIDKRMDKLDADEHHKHLAQDWGPDMLMQKITTAAKKYLIEDMTSDELDKHSLTDINDRRKNYYNKLNLDPLDELPKGVGKNSSNVNSSSEKVNALFDIDISGSLTKEEKEAEKKAYDKFFDDDSS